MSRAVRPASLPATGDRFVVVEASAGTGKTFFLEHRVVDLVLAGAELSQILLVTFTDKAVAELRLRIRDLLDRLARTPEGEGEGEWVIDEVARKRLRDSVTSFDHAPIFTIHGFCYRILVEDAFSAQRLFEQTQVADEIAFDAAFLALLRERFANTEPDRGLLSAYLSRGDTVDKLRALLLACARKDAPSRVVYAPEAALELGEGLRVVFGSSIARDALLDRLAFKGHDKRYGPAWIAAIGQAVDDWDGTPGGVFALCDAVRKSNKTEPGPKLLQRVIKVPQLAAIAEILRRALAMTSLDEAVAAVMLPHVIARIGADKAENGMFDYNDMLQLVRDALHGPRGAELATRLRARTPWVMIDEFQDTDPVQWNIFRTVWMDPAASGQLPAVTIVGDPKQAIYGFRGADVATYLDARDELLRNGATRVDLDINRRSTESLVEAVNKILLADGISPLLDQAIRYDHPVKASGDVELVGVRPPITVFQLTGEGKREESRQALASAIGVEISALAAAPPEWSSRGVQPPFTLGHCMVLTRTNSDSDGVARALRARGIACALVEGDRLFETREAHELADVLAAIAAPRDRSARMRALRTRYFDVAWGDLMRVVDAPDHHPLIARLFDWAALASRRSYESLFRRVVEDSRFAERALVLGGGERATINTWHLIELLLEEVARSRCDLHELVTQLRRWITDGSELPDDRDVQRAETDADAVRILTVHKAKGLEAPYVFVYGAASPPRASAVHTLRDGAGRALIVGPQDDAIAKQLVLEADAENQRLAYVALTRAKVRLYLPRYPDDVVDAKSMYWPIQRCLAPLAMRKDPLFELRDIAMGGRGAPPAPPTALAGFEPPAPPRGEGLVAIDGARAGLAMLSYTRLGRELDAAAIEPGELPVAIDPAEFDAEPASTILVAADELPPGIDSGLLLHDLLEHADLAFARQTPEVLEWARDRGVADMITEHARERGIASMFHAHAARVVHRALVEPMQVVGRDPLPALADATAFAREVEFAFPIPGGATPRGLVKGYIDALVAYDNELWVLDYKSDVLPGDPKQSAEDHARSHYAIQQRLYALAADRMRGERRLAGMLFAFVRYGVVVALPVDDAKLAEWSSWLEDLRTEATA